MDEFYRDTVVAFVPAFALFLFKFDKDWVIDWIVNWVGRLGVILAGIISAIDAIVVDGLVNGVGWVTDQMGSVVRLLQEGRVQAYLVFAMIVLSIWLLLNVLPLILTLV